MKKVITIFKILIILIVMIIALTNTVNAMGFVEGAQEIMTEGIWGWWLQDDTHMDIDIKIGNTTAITSSKAMTGRILGAVQLIGSIASVIALIIIGFRYMCSSVEDRASMKGILIYYVIGAVLVFATSNILSVVYRAISGLTI